MVQRREARAGLGDDRAELVEGHEPRAGVGLEVGADEVLQHEERHAVGHAAVDDVRHVGVVEPRERAGLVDEAREDRLALLVVGPRERVGLGDLQHEIAVRAGLSHEPHGAHAPVPEGAQELVALDDLGPLTLRRRRRRGRAPHRGGHRGLHQRRGHRAQRPEPHAQGGEVPLTDRARDQGRHPRGLLAGVIPALVQPRDGVFEGGLQALRGEHQREALPLQLGLRARGRGEARERVGQGGERCGELGVVRVQGLQRVSHGVAPRALPRATATGAPR